MPHTKQLANLTWSEINHRNGIVIPVGTCEQHGKHLPMNTDIILAEYFSNLIAEHCDFYIAPTINYGVNLPCDRMYTGTTTTQPTHLADLITSLLVWWSEQGFANYILVSAHGDPFHIQALQSIEYPSVRISVIELFDCDISDILERQSTTKHACEAETSVMLALFPERVRRSEIVDFETPFSEFKPYLFHEKTNPISNSPGVQGYPSYANLEKGELIIQRISTMCLERCNAIDPGTPR